MIHGDTEVTQDVRQPNAAAENNVLSKLIEENKGIVAALGVATFIAIAGYSAARLLKDKKLRNKIKDGIKAPKALKFVDELFRIEKLKDSSVVKAVKDLDPKKIKKAAKKELKNKLSITIPSKKKSKDKSSKKKKNLLDVANSGRKKNK